MAEELMASPILDQISATLSSPTHSKVTCFSNFIMLTLW